MARVFTGHIRAKNCSYVFLDQDEHVLCQVCSGQSCSKVSPCAVCKSCSDELWRSFETSFDIPK